MRIAPQLVARSPRIIHVAKSALDALRGVESPPDHTPPAKGDWLACGLLHWPESLDTLEWLTARSITLWECGLLTVLPNCPLCSVAWDEAMEAYNSRKQAST